MGDNSAWTQREPVVHGTPNPAIGDGWRQFVLNNPEEAAQQWAEALNQQIARGMPPPTSADFDA